MGELQVIGSARMAEHDAVEAVVILESTDHFEAQAIAVEAKDVGHVVCRASDT